jgi:hypothetical protein
MVLSFMTPVFGSRLVLPIVLSI